jgi:hypothetical protein
MMKNVELTKKYLFDLYHSISAQKNKNFVLHLVHDRDLETFLPSNEWKIHHLVEFDPLCDPDNSSSLKNYFNDFRIDKGQRIYQVFKNLDDDDHFMVIDDDDLVHHDLTDVLLNNCRKGDMCVLKRGYELREKSKQLYCLNDFDRQCGTSLACKVELYEAFGQKNPSKEALVELGSHTLIKNKFNRDNIQKINIFDRLACYRTEHLNSSTSQITHLKQSTLMSVIKDTIKNGFERRKNLKVILGQEFGQK